MKSKKLKCFCSIFLVLTAGIILSMPSWAMAANSITLNYTLHTPPPPKGGGNADQASFEYWAKEVAAQTDGRVKCKMFYSSVLGKGPDFYKMVGGTGVADIGNIIGAYNKWTLPLFAGAMLPFLTSDMDVEWRAVQKLYNEWPPMKEEWVKWNMKPLWGFVVDPYYLVIKKEITSLDQLKGEKIWGAGGFAEILKNLGITQVFFPAPQAYEALQKRTLDGIIFPYGPISAFKYYEVAKVFVDMSFAGGQTPAAQAINLDVWNKISSKDQKTIERISAGMNDWYLNYYKNNKKNLDAFYKKQGVKIISLSPQEQKRIKDICAEKIWTNWVKTAKAKGLPAEEFLRRYRATVREMSQ